MSNRTFIKYPTAYVRSSKSLHDKEDPKVNTELRGVRIIGKLYDELDYEDLLPTLNCLIDMRDRIAHKSSELNRCRINPGSMELHISGQFIFIYFYVSVDDYIVGRGIEDQGLQDYLKANIGEDRIHIGGNLDCTCHGELNPNPSEIWSQLIAFPHTWMGNFDRFEQWISDYYTRMSGNYNSSPASFSWSLKSLFGNKYQFPQSGDFVKDLDSCYTLFDKKVSELVPNFELRIDRQVDPDDDIDFEDVLKFTFNDRILKTRLDSQYLEQIYNYKGSKGIISELLKLVGRVPNVVKVIQKNNK